MNKTVAIFFIVLQLLVLQGADAEVVEARLPYTPNVSEAVVVVFENEKAKFVNGDVSHVPEGTIVKASLAQLSPEALYSGVAFLSDGATFSSSVTRVGHAGSPTLVKLGTLRQENAELDARLLKLKAEEAKVSQELRAKAGLEEVDAVFAKVKAIEEQIAQAKMPSSP